MSLTDCDRTSKCKDCKQEVEPGGMEICKECKQDICVMCSYECYGCYAPLCKECKEIRLKVPFCRSCI